MKRNTAYVASQPISEEIYDEVELPEYERAHARQTKEGVKSKAKEMSTDGKKSTKTCMVLAFVIGVATEQCPNANPTGCYFSANVCLE